MDAKATGALIARRRKALGLSQEELAERLHVTDKAVSKWETGRGMPGLDSLEPLARELGLSVSEVLSGRELTAEELPEKAGEQIVEAIRKTGKMVWRGAAATVAAAALAVGLWLGFHWFTTVPETDLAGLERQAAEYLGRPRRSIPVEFDYETLSIVETERRGDYLAALCSDGQGRWAMCVYDRDPVFRDRWRGGGGKPSLTAGELGSWNFGFQGDAVIIFCGGDLPEEAACYRFQNSGITYTCPIENGRVLDVFLLPDTSDISSYPEEVLDAEGGPVNVR